MRTLFALMLFFPSCVANAQPAAILSKLTIGFGAGYHITLGRVKEYSLTTDAAHTLRIQDASRGAFVLSSVATFRLGQVSTVSGTGGKLYNPGRIRSGFAYSASTLSAPGARAPSRQRWTLNLAINFAEISDQGSPLNKPLDGGLGLGYSLNDVAQIGVFLDVQRVRQLHNWVEDTYDGASIPQATGIYTALDRTDDDLFTTRTFAGLSLKLIVALPNKQN